MKTQIPEPHPKPANQLSSGQRSDVGVVTAMWAWFRVPVV